MKSEHTPSFKGSSALASKQKQSFCPKNSAKKPILKHVIALPHEAVPWLAVFPVPLQEDKRLIAVLVHQGPKCRHVQRDITIKLYQPVLSSANGRGVDTARAQLPAKGSRTCADPAATGSQTQRTVLLAQGIWPDLQFPKSET